MDFTGRSPHPAGNNLANPNPHPSEKARSADEVKREKWYRVGVFAGILAVVVILVGVCLLIYSLNSTAKDTESSYVKSNKLQAVFLQTGQVYFGNISQLNNNFLVLNHIFYLQTSNNSSSSSSSNSTSGSNVSLVKLGCELHMPYDQMVINRSQVTFWENLQDSGQVAKAVTKWNSAHPNGQQCTDQSSSSSNTSSSVQNATPGSTSSTSGTTTTKP